MWIDVALDDRPMQRVLPLFMVRAELLARDGGVLARCARPVVIPHEPWPVRVVRWAWRLPLLPLLPLVGGPGSRRESVHCFDQYIESEREPAAGAALARPQGLSRVPALRHPPPPPPASQLTAGPAPPAQPSVCSCRRTKPS